MGWSTRVTESHSSLNKSVYSWLALAVAMHVSLLLSIGVSGSKALPTESKRVMQVVLGGNGASSKLPNTLPGKRVLSDAKSNTLPPPKAVSEIPVIDHNQSASVSDDEMAIGTPISDLPFLTVPVLPEPYYFHAKELTERPQTIQDAPPQMTFVGVGDPPESVILRLLINESGDVDKVLIENDKITGEMAYLIESTMKKMKFTPGKIEDVPVKSQVRIELQLDPPIKQSTQPMRLP